MPQDLLEIKLNSRIFFDNIRRLITIERFLKNKRLNIISINEELKNLIGFRLYEIIRNNGELEDITIILLRKIIKSKLDVIMKLLKNGKE